LAAADDVLIMHDDDVMTRADAVFSQKVREILCKIKVFSHEE